MTQAPGGEPCWKCGAPARLGVVECAGGADVEAAFCETCKPLVLAELDRVASAFTAYRAEGMSVDTATRAVLRWHRRTT